jgi:hypothetical protein
VSWPAFLASIKSVLSPVPTPLVPDNSLNKDAENVRVVYAALVAKRTNYDLMLWQAPMISLTAQAFLLQIALGDGRIVGHKIISGLAATLIGLASWHLFVRHSLMERETSEKLEMIEEKYQFSEKAHCPPAKRCSLIASFPGKHVWGPCLLLISFVGLIPWLEMVWKILFPI